MTPRYVTRRLGWAAALCALAACVDITVDSRAIGSLEFVPLPYPSIDAGDSLRDANGVAAPLQARAYRADGTLDPTIPVTFLAFDTLVSVAQNSNFLRARSLSFTVTSFSARLLAAAGTLQTPTRSINVVTRPDTIVSQTTSQQDTIDYNAPAAASDTSMSLAVRLRGKNGSTPIDVPSYIVRYSLRNTANQPLSATDTALAFFLIEGTSGRVSTVDTTDGGGAASRTLRFRIRQGQKAVDTVQVLAEVRRGSRIVRGEPLSWLVIVRPKGSG